MSDARLLVPIPEVRHNLGGLGRTTIYDMIDRGELVRVKIGTRAFITAESLAAYVDRITAAASTDR
jgi:excisionase family DNA binding protein